MAESERLQKYLARAGIGSRRHSEQLIAEGRVAVNGSVVDQLGAKVDPDVDLVTVDGKRVVLPPSLIYVLLNKPAGVVTTVEEQRGRPTVLDVVRDTNNVFPPRRDERQKAAALKDYRLFPVGRLDLDTEGLLILTNDGELTNRLTHPRYALEKEYVVQVKGRPTEENLDRLRDGVEIDGKLTAPAKVSLIRAQNGSSRLRVIIHEGRKRQVRRMFEAVGYPVDYLDRIRVGPIKLGDLPVGRFRFLGGQEVQALRQAVGMPAPGPASKPGPISGRKANRGGSGGASRGGAGEQAGRGRTESKRSAYSFKNSDRRA